MPTQQQYLIQAQKALDTFEYKLAFQILERALALGESSQIYYQMATCHLEQSVKEDGHEDAINLFLRALELGLDTESDWKARLALGQLLAGEESMKYYEQGIQMLEKLVHEQPELKRHLSNALCAATELYMTDLWYLWLMKVIYQKQKRNAKNSCQKHWNAIHQTQKFLLRTQVSCCHSAETMKLLFIWNKVWTFGTKNQRKINQSLLTQLGQRSMRDYPLANF